MLFFADRGERRKVQALLIGTVTAMVVTSLLVVNFLNHPYGGGSGSLEPTSMTRTVGDARLFDDASPSRRDPALRRGRKASEALIMRFERP